MNFCEDVKKVQSMPGKELTDAPDYREQVNAFRQGLDESLQQLETQEQKIREGEQRLSRLQEEVRVSQLRPKPERHGGIPDDIRLAIEDRLAKIEEKLQRNQQQYSRWQEDSVRDFQAVEAYLTRVHTMVTELHQTEGSSSAPSRPRMTQLTAVARKGDLRVEVESPDVCRVGEVVLIGEQQRESRKGKG